MAYSGFASNHFSNPYAPAIPSGTILADRYRILKLLGQGGFGRTYQAADTNRFDEICVLKEFAPQVHTAADVQFAKDLFQREAGVLYRLNHPQIPRFRELRQIDHAGYSYLMLAQDFVEGTTYREMLQQVHPSQMQTYLPQGMDGNTSANGDQTQGLSVETVIEMLKQLLPVLEYLHRNGVIHRDISPANLIQRSHDRLPVLIDFGAVKQIFATVISQVSNQQVNSRQANHPSSSSTGNSAIYINPGTCIGKQGFAPPEQFQSGQVLPHSDIYALGATALTLLSGLEPSQLINPATLEWQIPDSLAAHSGLAAVLKRMVAFRPSDRYTSAAQTLNDLERQLAPQPGAFPTQPPVSSHSPAHNPELSHSNPRPPASQMPTQAVAPAYNPAPDQAPAPANAPAPALSQTPGQTPAPVSAQSPAPSAPLAEPPRAQASASSNRNLPTQQKPPIFKLLGSSVVAIAVILGGITLGYNLFTPDPELPDKPVVENPTPDDKPAAPPIPKLPPAEQARKQRLVENRKQLRVPETYLNQLVNDEFYRRHPELEGRKLNRFAADADLRDEWDEIAFDWLETLEVLPVERRKKLGSYNNGVRDRWISQINQKRLGSRALSDMVNVQSDALFPNLQLSANTTGPRAQIWRAIAANTVANILNGNTLASLKLDANQQANYSGTVATQRGMAHVVQLKKGQPIRLDVESIGPLEMAFYPPRSNQAALQPLSDSLSWEGVLEADGFYEVVLIAAGESADYNLNLTVIENEEEGETESETEDTGPTFVEEEGDGKSPGEEDAMDPDSPVNENAAEEGEPTQVGEDSTDANRGTALPDEGEAIVPDNVQTNSTTTGAAIQSEEQSE